MKKNILKQLFVVGLVVSQTFLIASLEAEIFKCTNLEGKVYYNDKPCPVKDNEEKIKAEKDVKNGYTPPAFVEKSEAKRTRGVVVGDGKREVFDDIRDKEKSEELLESNSDNKSASGRREQANQSANGGSSNVKTSNNSAESDDEAADRRRASERKNLKPRKLTVAEKRKILNVEEVHE